VGFGFGVLIALLLLVIPGALIARAGGLTVTAAVAVGPALTYGTVALTIVPLGAIGVPWNAWTALFAVAIVGIIAAGLRRMLARFRDPDAEASGIAFRPAMLVAAGVLLGTILIAAAAIAGLVHWQSIPSTWDSVWHANTIRWILETGQASPTHMGELRNVETHEALYYPSAFHALAAVYCQITGAAATTAYTVSSVTAAVFLFPLSAAVLAWKIVRPHTSEMRTATVAATAAALAASFTAVPYVEFDVAAMPNLVAYGLAVPTFALIASTPAHRDRIGLAVLATVGVFSVHITGGVVTALLVGAWWLLERLPNPARGRRQDFVTLLIVAVPALLIMLPQFLSVAEQADIIAGHAFVNHLGRKRSLFTAIVQHTRHLNDFPIQNILIALAAIGGLVMLIKRMWWPLAVWALLVVAIVHSGAPFGGPLGAVTGKFSDLFYSDPRRLSAVVTMLYAPMAAIGLCTLVLGLTALLARMTQRQTLIRATAGVVLVATTVGLAWHYFPRHRFLFGDKYDSVMVPDHKLRAFAHLAELPDARTTLIGDANTDGSAWMYAVAGLHPLWTHYDYPVQQGPGYHRFIFWAYADDADTDPRVAEAVEALNIRYVITTTPVVRGFAMPDGLLSLDSSRSWEKIYDNGGDRIYRWRGEHAATRATH
jgi:D-galactosaminyltransferase